MHKAKNYFWVLLDLFLLGMLVGLVLFVMPAVKKYGNSLISVRTITVSAEGKATVTPDVALTSFSVVSQGKNPEELTDSNSQKMSAVVEFVKSQGVEAKDMKTTNFNLVPDYEYDENIRRRFIVGYTSTQTLSIKVRDLTNVATIIGGLTPLGVNQIGNVSFTVDDPEKFLDIARSDAFRKARAKAVGMVAENSARLGRVLHIGESGFFPQISFAESFRGLGGDALSSAALPTIEPGTQEIKAQVTLTYELK